jgi:hypothetical protein
MWLSTRKGGAIEVMPGVDEIEDTKSPRVHKFQQTSIGDGHLIETKHIENKAFLQSAENCLGLRGSPM